MMQKLHYQRGSKRLTYNEMHAHFVTHTASTNSQIRTNRWLCKAVTSFVDDYNGSKIENIFSFFFQELGSSW